MSVDRSERPGRRRSRRFYLTASGVAAAAIVLLALSEIGRGQSGSTMFTDIATPAMADRTGVAESACWADVDGDSDQDLFVAKSNGPSRLWRNEGNGSFTDAGEAAGVSRDLRTHMACAFVDIDSDGDLDLFVTARGNRAQGASGNKLYKNNGDGTFTDMTQTAGVAMPRLGVASSDWADYDADGDYDAFVAVRYGRKKYNAFFEQSAPFTFRDIAAEKGLADPAGPQKAFLGSWFDYDGDGDLDLIFAIDWWGVELYRNDDGTFTRVTTTAFPPATDSTPGAPPNNAMGVAWGDYDNDGCTDVFISGMNFWGQGGFDSEHLTDLASRLYRNNCNGTFSDATRSTGLSPTGAIEWAANFIDFDNDGDLDLSVVAGGEAPEVPRRSRVLRFARQVIVVIITVPRRFIPPGLAAWAYRYEAMIPHIGTVGPAGAMPNYLYKNQLVETRKATFVNVIDALGAGDFGATRGSAWADMDNDGDLDWFVPNKATPSRLFRNNGPVGNYLRVHLVGDPLRDAVGAWVKINAGGTLQYRHVHVLDGYLSQSQLDPHFGLGSAQTVDEVWVRWPGTTTWVLACKAVPADRTVTVAEGAGCRW